jgi:hypothetical protein
MCSITLSPINSEFPSHISLHYLSGLPLFYPTLKSNQIRCDTIRYDTPICIHYLRGGALY